MTLSWLAAAGFSGEALRPWYHFHRREGEMNDPNGLQWRRLGDDPASQVSYEMFHQHSNGSTACYGSEGSGHVWAHASSPDLVRWVRRPETAHMTCASTGAGITLPPGFKGPNGESWLSANLGSAPAMAGFPDETVGRGLKLWVSNNSATLNEYYEYLPPGTKTIVPATRQNDACVICPAGVRPGPSNPPNWTRAADIGDSYIWSEPEWNVPSANRTFYAMSGQGHCPRGSHPPSDMWCGWAKGKEPQALLWSSKNLVDWRFVSEFYNGSRDDYTAVMTPETFTFATGEQAFIWLGSKNTLWVTGRASRRGGELHHFTEQRFNGNPSMGWVDPAGGTHCGQSMWDAKGRRIQFMWLGLSLPGANYTGAQTLPREIALAPPGSVTGLLFRPIPELETLHAPAAPVFDEAFTLAPGAGRTFAPADDVGLHCHVKATLTMPPSVEQDCSVSLIVRAVGATAAGAPRSDSTSLLVNVSHAAGQRVVTFGSTAPVNISRGSADVELEVFVDGAIVELFVNGGERVLTTNSGNPGSIAGTGLGWSASGLSANVSSFRLWGMSKAISGP